MKPTKRRPYIWTTREGLRIPVTQMEDSHLNNAIAFLERKTEELSIELNRPISPLRLEAYRAMLEERARRDGEFIEPDYRILDEKELPSPSAEKGVIKWPKKK